MAAKYSRPSSFDIPLTIDRAQEPVASLRREAEARENPRADGFGAGVRPGRSAALVLVRGKTPRPPTPRPTHRLVANPSGRPSGC